MAVTANRVCSVENCTSCNSIIGLAQDSTERLEKAVAYLRGNQWQ